MSDQGKEADQHEVITTEKPPTSILGIMRRLGPGLIVAGSIVGSGELIATTATGAAAGYWLLWLILIGCVIKVFVQVELGRYAIVNGKTTMSGMNEVPGPRIAGVNWLLWYYVLMFLASLAQLGGIVGGVGQALAISMPLTEAGRAFNEQVNDETEYRVAEKQLLRIRKLQEQNKQVDADQIKELTAKIARLGPKVIATRLKVGNQRISELEASGNNEAKLKQLRAIKTLLIARRDSLGQETDRNRPEKLFDDSAVELKGKSDDFKKSFLNYGKRRGYDDKWWAAIIAIASAVILVMGKYGFIQTFSTVLVASFTLITIVNLFALQTAGEWAVTWSDIQAGMSFQLTPKEEALNKAPLVTALATFGIIGVGASELVTYPYWCLEKGYARFTGPRDDSPEWKERALGWLRVMRWDAWCSMVVYTFATIAFYLLGAAILHAIELTPEGTEMIRTLAVMYEPVFGSWTQYLFLFGAIAVLYSTFFVANASHARVFPDALRVIGIPTKDEAAHRRRVRIFSGIFPLACLLVYVFIPKPKVLVLLSGTMQAIMLPMLSFAAIYFRYKKSDRRVMPGRLWDIFLWISAVGMLIAGGWLFLTKVFPALEDLG